MKPVRATMLAWALAVVVMSGGVLQAHAGAAPRAAATAAYAGGLLAAENGYNTGGAAAILGGSGHLTAAVIDSGLTPKSAYMVRIQSGACGTTGSTRYTLPKLEADTAGDAMTIGTLSARSIPAPGYSLRILDSKGTAVSCGNLQEPDLVVQLKGVGGSKAGGTALILLHAPVNGVTEKIGTQVIIYATGLQPKTAQPDHIHAGLCGKPSPVKYALLTLVPDAKGRAIGGSGITDIIPTTGVSIHIHDSAFNLVACGNLGS